MVCYCPQAHGRPLCSHEPRARVILSARAFTNPLTGEAEAVEGNLTQVDGAIPVRGVPVEKQRNIERLNADGSIQFEGGEWIAGVDVVMYCTGEVVVWRGEREGGCLLSGHGMARRRRRRAEQWEQEGCASWLFVPSRVCVRQMWPSSHVH